MDDQKGTIGSDLEERHSNLFYNRERNTTKTTA